MTIITLLYFAFAANLTPASRLVAGNGTQGAVTKSVVRFNSNSRVLQGYLYKPVGKAPFPAVLWNHGSEPKPTDQPALAAHYTSQGYVFFVPHRRGQGLSPGPYIRDQISALWETHDDPHVVGAMIVRLLEEQNTDVVAALDWLKSQRDVDKSRIFMSGGSFGGIQTLLAAEKGLGLRGAIPFAPGAMSWDMTEIADRLIDASHNAKVPLFLLQARNDFSLHPSQVLGPLIVRRGGPNRAKLYPNFGDPEDHRAGHAGFAVGPGGIQVWGPDVADFMRDCLTERR
jgi:carboxymethylenebutenolidase